MKKDTTIMHIQIEGIDKYPTGTYHLGDHVTVISAQLRLSVAARVKRIERDMTNADYVKLDLANRMIEYWELDEPVRRTINDLAGKVTG